MATINQPLQIKSVTLRNRVGMPPMCQYSSTDGFANDWHFVHYGARAVGGAGLIIVEATAVAPEGRITPSDLGIWDDAHIPQLQRIAEFIHSQGSVAAIQIAHAGRKASHDVPQKGGKQLSPNEGGWTTLAPSALPFEEGERLPKELSASEIADIVGQFKDASVRVHKAGFKAIEIHSAHGYLLHEFLSPLTNLRSDEYGGSFENRSRFLLEVVKAVQTVWPSDLPLLVRLSATDWTAGGWDVAEFVQLCSLLKDSSVDLIDCSSGGNIFTQQIPLAPGYQVEFASAVKKIGILTSAVGLITTTEQVSEILREEKADLVLLGRELLRNPYFPIVATLKSTAEIEWPVQYLRSK
ncbi:MAG: NADH:flavin oxidoreductase/NADH oxidase [Bacteroidales bacterium]